MNETPQPPSPLSEADPNSIDELFSRLKNNQIKLMPREISPLPLRKRIETLRLQRLDFTKDYEAHKLEKSLRIRKPKLDLTGNDVIEF